MKEKHLRQEKLIKKAEFLYYTYKEFNLIYGAAWYRYVNRLKSLKLL